MSRVVALLVAALCVTAHAAETQVLPRGVFVLETSYLHSTLDSQWSNEGRQESLLPSITRYEPGGGLQGVITARPDVSFDIVLTQLLYGVTDDLTLAIGLPFVRHTQVKTNLGWEEGDYQPQLGRAYSEDDFWAWAASMGQGKPPEAWRGNQNTLADMVLGARYRLPNFSWLARAGLTAAVGLQIALPTGRPADREEVVSVGTTAWDLHSYGDVELHGAVSRTLWKDGAGVERLSATVDVFYAWLRPRTYQTPRGEKNPLLMNFAPYVGDSYVIDGGDWLATNLTLESALWAGPTARGLIYKEAPAPTGELPPLLSASLSYSHVRTGQTDWQSESPLWEWDREKYWRPGFKNILRGTLTASFVRVGVPVQAYASYRTQTLIPGKNVRPSNVLSLGIRLLAKFW